jgi:hypothetical protein
MIITRFMIAVEIIGEPSEENIQSLVADALDEHFDDNQVGEVTVCKIKQAATSES